MEFAYPHDYRSATITPHQSMRHFLRWCFYSFVSDLCRHYPKYRSLWHGSCRHVSKISAQNACLLDLGYPYLHCATMEFLSQKLIFVNIPSVFVLYIANSTSILIAEYWWVRSGRGRFPTSISRMECSGTTEVGI